MEIEELIYEIKRKRELRNIADDAIKNIMLNELEKRPYLIEIIKNSKSIRELKRNKEFLYFFKEVRALLHQIYGVFAPKDIKRIFQILDSNTPIKEKIIEILKLSRSTKERLNFYPEIYSNIFLEPPYEILDIASGINPPSIIFSKNRPEKYYFIDISEDILYINDVLLRELYIDPFGILMDIFYPSNEIYKHYQYIFLWKTIPILEKYKLGYAKEFISKLDYDYLVVSFAKKSLSGKRSIGRAWKPWLYALAKDLDLSIIKEFETKNEMFFILTKNF